ncbi:hypothetical protein QOZ80_9AG0682170 [Eleusine coracana subsp. coracana]|nr:hypothetical protein QOZ80_9AG0682170 [Eleusine coracana subsp. coracana]
MKKQARARRQRIPAFGEWNYDYGADWPVTQYFDSAMQAGLVMAVPPSPKPLKKAVKWSDSATLEEDEKQHKVVGDHGAVKKQGKQSRVADAGPHAAGYNSRACRVVKAVDQDLYEIPPDMLCYKPKKAVTRRSVWLGCLGLSCIA